MHERLQLLARRRFSWFFSSETANEQYVPEILSGRVLMFAGLLPLSVWLALAWDMVAPPVWILTLLILTIVDDVCAYRYFRIGMDVGRLELVFEMYNASIDEPGLDPREYLMREVQLGQEKEFRTRPFIRTAPLDPPETG
jgi:hypothetical protein